MTTSVSGVIVSNYYSYCACSSVNQEVTVINDGTPRTYITSYSHNLAGQLVSITYPNGKVVTYAGDAQGREIKASSTYNGQAFDYIYDAAYEGPQGAVTKITFPIWYGSQRMAMEYSYSPQGGKTWTPIIYFLPFPSGLSPFSFSGFRRTLP